MKTCRACRTRLVDLVSETLDRNEREAIMTHLENCASCRAEKARLEKLFEAAAAGKRDADQATEGIDWEALALRIADAAEGRALGRRAGAARQRPVLAWLFRPALAYLAAGLVIGGLTMFAVFKAGLLGPGSRPAYFVSGGFLDKTEMELARRETVDYLERSQYLLLDLSQAPASEAGSVWQKEVASGSAADLLSRKKFIDSELDKIPMAKAREICDQIEALCLELSQVSGQLDASQWKEIQDRVQQSQMLLKINLVKKELQSREI